MCVAERLQICSPQTIYEAVSPEVADAEQEHLYVLLLDTKNRIRRQFRLYQGTLNGCAVRVGEVFREAVRENAAAIAIAHNHPSGDPEPSPQDVELTRGLILAGELLDIDVLDHVIIGGEGTWISLRERHLAGWK